MTQQFDLTFTTTNTMDKMMTQGQSKSYSSNSYVDADKFDNFLSNANKSYTHEDVKNDKAQSQTKSNVKNENNNKYEKSNNTVSENKVEYKESGKQEEVSNDVVSEDTETNEKVSLKNNENVMDDLVANNILDDVISENEVDVKEMMLVSNAQLSNIEVTPKNVSNLEKSFAMSDVSVDEEIPADAIKSGINIETLSRAIETPVEDSTDVDMQTVDNAIKDTVVSKDDAISAMYKTQVVDEDNALKTNAVKVDDVVQNKDVKVETNTKDLKMEEVPVVKDENEQQSLVSDSVKFAETDDTKIETKDVKNLGNEILETKTNEKEINLEVNNEVVDNKQEKVADVQDVKELKTTEENNEVVNDTNSKEVKNVDNLDKVQVVKNIKTDKDDLKATKDEQENVVELVKTTKDSIIQETNAINLNDIADSKTQNVETPLKVTSDKLNELKEEVQTAKAENAFETLSTQSEKVSQNDKKVADKFAKTNAEFDETMEIEDDTKGIEFISNKTEKVVDKSDVQDKSFSAVKEKVENVKIQVEDDVKVVTNQTQDSAKTEKANETMTKAGLTTKTLREMDGKITSMETGNQSSAQFGETSQEMLMRDMLSQEATVQTGEAKTTVDFTQALNKTTTAQQPQAQQNPQEAQEVNILDQIRAKFAVSKQNGLQKITIGLTPESLGKVTVEIVKGQNGISANLLAENPQVKEILDKNLDSLKSVLQTQGVNVNNVNVKVAEAGRSSENNNNMFQNDDSQFNQESGGEHSRENNSSSHEKHSEYKFMNNSSVGSENIDSEDIVSNTVQMEKTVSIKGGNGKISYKL